MSDCIFCDIINKRLKAQVVYEDEEIIAFYDINPKAQIHYLVAPKEHIESMLTLEDKHQLLMGKILIKTNQIAKQSGLEGYKININNGIKGGQEINHLHIHLLGNK